jgi:ribosome-binding protein aMBF1 (putative translation factor)
MITGAQIRRARERLGWSVEQLGRRIKLRPSTIERAERTLGEPSITIMQLRAIQAALESAGIEFTKGDEPGVKLKRKR